MTVIKVAPVAARGAKQIDPAYHACWRGSGMKRMRRPEINPGQEAIYKLATCVDVVMESYRPGVADRLKVGYEDIKAVNPAIIYCSTSGYGQDGPYSQWVGHDINYLAVGGYLYAVADGEGKPAIPGATVADSAGGGCMRRWRLLLIA